MTAERWQRIEEIYHNAVELGPRQRQAYLDEACASDSELRGAVEDLLAADGNIDGVIEAAVREEAEKLAAKASESIAGKRIGPYRVTGMIGAGGMGAIYRAVRDDGEYRKEVAIKVVKRGMDLAAVVVRFRQERQVLARLEHPNIARLIDGGVAGGQPYFVMEYVEGRPLTEYCAGLPLRERLQLFRRVCAAVQCAHQNLIVHRDLKPANILVTKDGDPKLLDFGLAKLLSPDEAPEETFTAVRMFTPDYASPEQMRGETITTASDIYSLGAVLYEVISGRRAHQFSNRTTTEMERVICKTDPPPLPGELGNIAQMAMQKEPQRRYATVEQLSEDVRRYMEGLPVRARKDTAIYRVDKFVRRNKLAVGAAALALLSMAIGTSIALSQAHRLQQQVETVRRLATTMLFEVNWQIANLPGSLKARETLVREGLKYLDQVSLETGGDPTVQWELAQGYVQIGTLQAGPGAGDPNVRDTDGARRSYQTALALAERLRARDSENRDVLFLLAKVHQSLAAFLPDAGESIRHLQESLRLFNRLGSSREVLAVKERAASNLAFHYLRSGDPQAALDTARSSQAPIARHTEAYALEAMGDLPAAVAVARANVGRGENTLRTTPEEYLHRRAVRLGASDSHVVLGTVLGNRFFLNLGDEAGALNEYRAALAHAERNAARDSADHGAKPVLARALAGMGACLIDRNAAESLARYQRAIGILTQLSPGVHTGRDEVRESLAAAHWQISYPLRRLGRREEAVAELNRSLALQPSASAHNAMGDLWLEAGDRARALEEYRQALALAEKESTAKPRIMVLRRDLADCYERLGSYYGRTREWQQARNWYAKSLNVWTSWSNWGVSSVYDQRRRNQAESAVARYGRLLSGNSPE